MPELFFLLQKARMHRKNIEPNWLKSIFRDSCRTRVLLIYIIILYIEANTGTAKFGFCEKVALIYRLKYNE